jgi:hypothetical protein
MRAGLVVVLLLLLAAVAIAEDSASKPTTRYTASASSKSMALPFHFYGGENRSAVGDDPQKNVCLDLRTMVVARDEHDADATHVVSQRTCTPARQFQTKAAVVNPR